MVFEQVFLSDMYLGWFIFLQWVSSITIYMIFRKMKGFTTRTQKLQSLIVLIGSLFYSFCGPYLNSGAFVALNQHFNFNQSFILVNLLMMSLVFLGVQYLLYSFINRD